MPFVDIDEIGVLLKRTLFDEEKDQVGLLIDQATAAIKGWTRQTIDFVADDTVVLAGTWSPDLELPQRPVAKVSAVSVNGVALVPGGWAWNERQLIRIGAGPRAFDSPIGASDQLQTSAGWHWSGPQATVEVSYSHGFVPIPDDIAAVCRAMVMRSLLNPAGVKSESIGGYSVTYADVDGGGVGLAADDKALLRRYRRWWA